MFTSKNSAGGRQSAPALHISVRTYSRPRWSVCSDFKELRGEALIRWHLRVRSREPHGVGQVLKISDAESTIDVCIVHLQEFSRCSLCSSAPHFSTYVRTAGRGGLHRCSEDDPAASVVESPPSSSRRCRAGQEVNARPMEIPAQAKAVASRD